MTITKQRADSLFYIRAAGQTAKGARRQVNEDCFAILSGGRFVVLADGAAGRPLGGIASRTAVEEVRVTRDQQSGER